MDLSKISFNLSFIYLFSFISIQYDTYTHTPIHPHTHTNSRNQAHVQNKPLAIKGEGWVPFPSVACMGQGNQKYIPVQDLSMSKQTRFSLDFSFSFNFICFHLSQNTNIDSIQYQNILLKWKKNSYILGLAFDFD